MDWVVDTTLSLLAPKSPELHLEPLNCTTISVRWLRDTEDPAAIQGYKLFYKEEGQQENGPIFLDTGDLLYTLSGLGECACVVQILYPPAATSGGRVVGRKRLTLCDLTQVSFPPTLRVCFSF